MGPETAHTGTPDPATPVFLHHNNLVELLGMSVNVGATTMRAYDHEAMSGIFGGSAGLVRPYPAIAPVSFNRVQGYVARVAIGSRGK